MALVATGWRMSFTAVDSAGDKSVRTYDLVATSAAEADTAADAALTAFALVSDSVITEVFVGEVRQETALVLPTDVENGVEAAVTAYINGLGSKVATWKVPGAKTKTADTIFLSTTGKNRNVVNLANAGVIQWNSLFVTGAGQRLYISDKEALKAAGMISGVRVVGGKRQPTP